jgi:hypothetical protein
MLYKNNNYRVVIVEEEVEGVLMSLYHVINNGTDMVEHKTVIFPDALQTADEFNGAVEEFELINRQQVGGDDNVFNIH